jgi:hypothetical protein
MQFLANAKPRSDRSTDTVVCHRRIVVRDGFIEVVKGGGSLSAALLFHDTGVGFRIDLADVGKPFQWEQEISLNFL